MRLGIVRGRVVLNSAVDALRGRTLLLIEPMTMDNLRAGNRQGGGKSLVAIDETGAGDGQMVAFTEGREAANPFWPESVPVDSYCSLIVDSINVRPQQVSQEI